MLLLLSFFISSAAPAFAGSCPVLTNKEATHAQFTEANKFLNYGKEESIKEHVLPPNSDKAILGLQQWTKMHENYFKKQSHSGELAIYVLQNRSVPSVKNSGKLLALYKLYSERAATLAEEVAGEFPTHLGMISDASYAKNYKKDFLATLASMSPDSSGRPGKLQQFDCDYLNQPTNALFYNVSAAALIDKMGTKLFGECWAKEKSALGVKSAPQVVAEAQANVAKVNVAAKSKPKQTETAEMQQAVGAGEAE